MAERDSSFMSKSDLDSYMRKYVWGDLSQSIILSENFHRPIDSQKLTGNNHVLVVGSSGSGKTRSVIAPNILQMNASYVVSDTFGEMARSLGPILKEHGYKVKILDLSCGKGEVPNLSDVGDLAHYNPFSYIRDEADLKVLIECLLNNTEGAEENNQFFRTAEELLYAACIFYLKDHRSYENKKNLTGLNDMLFAPLDTFGLLFGSLPDDSLSRRYYKIFCKTAGKMKEAVIASCAARLMKFMSPQMANLTDTDDLHLERIGEEKTAVFLIMSPVNRTCSCLVSMLYYQLLETICSIVKPLKVPVSLLMDDFADYWQIPDLPIRLATTKRRDVSIIIAAQSVSQLRLMYGYNWLTVAANVSTIAFLGAHDLESLNFFSELLAAKGCDVQELMSLPSDECIVFAQNMPPVRDKKYILEDHPCHKTKS